MGNVVKWLMQIRKIGSFLRGFSGFSLWFRWHQLKPILAVEGGEDALCEQVNESLLLARADLDEGSETAAYWARSMLAALRHDDVERRLLLDCIDR